jgi:SlyX protein
MSIESLERRLEDLEVKFAFQDDTIQQLDLVIQEQANTIHRLTTELATVREQLKETLGAEAPMEEQVPPHY